MPNIWEDHTRNDTEDITRDWLRDKAAGPGGCYGAAPEGRPRRTPQEWVLFWAAQKELALTAVAWMAVACLTVLTILSATVLVHVVRHP